jgi:hypothetical protein
MPVQRYVLVASDALARMGGEPTPYKQASEYEKNRMHATLNRQDISDDIRVTNYNQQLQEHLSHESHLRKPLRIDFRSEGDDEGFEDESKTRSLNVLQNAINTFSNDIAKTRASELARCLHRMKELSWNSKGEVAFNGHLVPGSNLFKLMGDIIYDRESENPIGSDELAIVIRRYRLSNRLVRETTGKYGGIVTNPEQRISQTYLSTPAGISASFDYDSLVHDTSDTDIPYWDISHPGGLTPSYHRTPRHRPTTGARNLTTDFEAMGPSTSSGGPSRAAIMRQQSTPGPPSHLTPHREYPGSHIRLQNVASNLPPVLEQQEYHQTPEGLNVLIPPAPGTATPRREVAHHPLESLEGRRNQRRLEKAERKADRKRRRDLGEEVDSNSSSSSDNELNGEGYSSKRLRWERLC